MRSRWPLLFIPLAAFIVIFPLLQNGCSCGHDFDFHLQSWLDVAQSWHDGLFYPYWMHSSAWLAGEPRFTFYPPLSWLLGGALAYANSLLPSAANTFHFVPIAYTFLILIAAGFAAYAFARTRVEKIPAVLCAVLYLANPYMLFVVYERTAYAELLAAIWFPLLLRALLAEEISVPAIAAPISLLWISNAPAGVMGCYTLGIIAIIRAALHRRNTQQLKSFSLRILGGLILGIALAAFYILPADFERRWVQITSVIGGNLGPLSNFLFARTADPVHDAVLATASWTALATFFLAIVFLVIAFLRRKENRRHLLTPSILTGALLIALTPVTAWLWLTLPQLKFLQFPWRFTAVIAAVIIIAAAFALPATLRRRWLIAAIALPCIAVPVAYHCFVQYCDDDDLANTELHGALVPTEPTDEYTPVNADPDALHLIQQPFFYAQNNDDPPPPTITAGNIIKADQPQTVPMPRVALEDRTLTIDLASPRILVLRLWDFPAWRATVNGVTAQRRLRNDGLMAIPLPAGHSTVHIWYAITPDHIAGDIITLIACLLLLFLLRNKHSPATKR